MEALTWVCTNRVANLDMNNRRAKKASQKYEKEEIIYFQRQMFYTKS
jgi:hypothetical protein